MPSIRNFAKYYRMEKCFAKKCDIFEIRLCMDLKTHEQRSVKIYRKSEHNEQRLEYLKREIDLLRTLDHPNLIKIYDVIEDELKIYCIIDVIKGQSLFDFTI